MNYHQLQAPPLVFDFALPIRLLSTYLDGFKIMKIKNCHIQGRDKVLKIYKTCYFQKLIRCQRKDAFSALH